MFISVWDTHSTGGLMSSALVSKKRSTSSLWEIWGGSRTSAWGGTQREIKIFDINNGSNDKDYHPTLQFPFGFTEPLRLFKLIALKGLSSRCSETTDELTVRYLPRVKQQTELTSWWRKQLKPKSHIGLPNRAERKVNLSGSQKHDSHRLTV